MKSLTLIRHAKAERDSPSGDFGRALDQRGRGDASDLGGRMRDLGLGYDLILASPAQRVVETVEGLGVPSPRFDPRIYNASTDQLIEIIRAVDDGVERLLIVGHNPGLERLAASMAGNERIDGFPTATLAEFELAIDDWRDFGIQRHAVSRRWIRPGNSAE